MATSRRPSSSSVGANSLAPRPWPSGGRLRGTGARPLRRRDRRRRRHPPQRERELQRSWREGAGRDPGVVRAGRTGIRSRRSKLREAVAASNSGADRSPDARLRVQRDPRRRRDGVFREGPRRRHGAADVRAGGRSRQAHGRSRRRGRGDEEPRARSRADVGEGGRAGFVYICNPNNPTGTLHGAKAIEEFVTDTLRRDPHVTILIDEAH